MGQHIIPGAGSDDLGHLIYHVEQQGVFHDQMVWDHGDAGMGIGVHFFDPTRSDEECAGLYATWQRNPGWYRPLPDNIRTHLQHLRDYLAEDPATITNAESVHVIKDLIRAVHFLNSRFEAEG